ncbi:hypothetical protein ZWY2020_059376 [Hordeum vulgare]|nr:hypothetical protein ZWY2020_059376 [Hordeum vulgare]
MLEPALQRNHVATDVLILLDTVAYHLCGVRSLGTLNSLDRHQTRIGSTTSWLLTNLRPPEATSSPMQFTPCTPGKFPNSSTVGRALQIYSIKIVDLNHNLDWPLHVYGVVAARDCYDHNRNILFYRSEANCQRVTQDDPFLHLIGPSRALVAEDSVMFEVQLKMKYGAESKDTALFTSSYNYRPFGRHFTIQIYSRCCTAELSLEQLTKAIQATIVGVRVVKGEWPCMYGCRVSCSLCPVVEEAIDSTPMEVVLLESHGEEMPAHSDGYIRLSRNVVSVDLHSTLKVCIQAYSDAGSTPLQGHVNFPVQQCQVSKLECSLGNSTVVEIIVAWSLLPMDELG